MQGVILSKPDNRTALSVKVGKIEMIIMLNKIICLNML